MLKTDSNHWVHRPTDPIGECNLLIVDSMITALMRWKMAFNSTQGM